MKNQIFVVELYGARFEVETTQGRWHYMGLHIARALNRGFGLADAKIGELKKQNGELKWQLHEARQRLIRFEKAAEKRFKREVNRCLEAPAPGQTAKKSRT